MTAPDILISCVDTAQARRSLVAQFKKQPSLAPRYWLDLGNTRLDGQVILGQPEECTWNRLRTSMMHSQEFVRHGTHGAKFAQARLPTVTEMFPEILDASVKESNEPTCSVAEALGRQSLFINDHLSTWAAQLLDDLLRIGELKWHGAFINLATGRVNPLPVPTEIEVKPDPQVTAEE